MVLSVSFKGMIKRHKQRKKKIHRSNKNLLEKKQTHRNKGKGCIPFFLSGVESGKRIPSQEVKKKGGEQLEKAIVGFHIESESTTIELRTTQEEKQRERNNNNNKKRVSQKFF